MNSVALIHDRQADSQVRTRLISAGGWDRMGSRRLCVVLDDRHGEPWMVHCSASSLTRTGRCR